GNRVDGAAGCRVIEALTDLPGQTLLEGFLLAVAAGEVDARSVAEDSIQRLASTDIASLQANGHHQLGLELEVFGKRWIGNDCSFRDDGIRGLLEEERRIPLVSFLHFTDMLDVVPSDAVDATYRKARVRTDDGKRRHLQRKYQFHVLPNPYKSD